MDNNFNASELTTIYNYIVYIKNAFRTLALAGRGAADTEGYIHDKIVSEDSNIAQTWSNEEELSKAISDKATKLLEKLQTEIENYVKATLANESQTAQNISDINSSLEENRGKLDAIEI